MGLRGRVPPPRSGLRRLYPAHPAISKTSEDARWTQPGTPVDCGPTNGFEVTRIVQAEMLFCGRQGNQSRLLRRTQDGFAWHGPLCGENEDSVKTPCS
jgi:hypothetical protein